MKYRGVVISGLPRSGKSTICQMTQREYGWPMLYLGEKVRNRYKLEVPDGSVSFEDWYETSSVEFNREINEEARRRMRLENLTIDSRLTSLCAPEMKAQETGEAGYCMIFVKASLDARVARAGLVDEGSMKKLAEMLLLREKKELDKGRLLFNGNYQDEGLYHHTLDTTQKNIEQTLDAIRGFLGKPGG